MNAADEAQLLPLGVLHLHDDGVVAVVGYGYLGPRDLQRQVRLDGSNGPDGVFDGLELRQGLAAHGHKIETRRLVGSVFGAVLPEDGSLGAIDQAHPQTHGQVLGQCLLPIGHPAMVEPRIDLRIPPLVVLSHRPGPLAGIGDIAVLIGVLAGKQVGAVGGKAPTVALLGASLVQRIVVAETVAVKLMLGIQAAHDLHLPFQDLGHVLIEELPEQQHGHQQVLGLRSRHVLPGPVSHPQALAQLLQGEALLQPLLVLGSGVDAVATPTGPVHVAAHPLKPGTVPDHPHAHGRRILVAVDHRPQHLFRVDFPHGMVETVSIASLHAGGVGKGLGHFPGVVDHPHVRVLAHHPVGTGHVGRQREVENDLQSVLGRQLEKAVEVAQFDLARLRSHPVPGGKASDRVEAGFLDGGEVLVPHLHGRHGGAVILHPHVVAGGLARFHGGDGCRRGPGQPAGGGHGSGDLQELSTVHGEPPDTLNQSRAPMLWAPFRNVNAWAWRPRPAILGLLPGGFWL